MLVIDASRVREQRSDMSAHDRLRLNFVLEGFQVGVERGGKRRHLLLRGLLSSALLLDGIDALGDESADVDRFSGPGARSCQRGFLTLDKTPHIGKVERLEASGRISISAAAGRS
jgi:hypothetical protein